MDMDDGQTRGSECLIDNVVALYPVRLRKNQNRTVADTILIRYGPPRTVSPQDASLAVLLRKFSLVPINLAKR